LLLFERCKVSRSVPGYLIMLPCLLCLCFGSREAVLHETLPLPAAIASRTLRKQKAVTISLHPSSFSSGMRAFPCSRINASTCSRVGGTASNEIVQNPRDSSTFLPCIEFLRQTQCTCRNGVGALNS
ncbi:hypothetical protein DFH11DRAFT_1606573, partial [Phellopilus nigrolimitatus]